MIINNKLFYNKQNLIKYIDQIYNIKCLNYNDYYFIIHNSKVFYDIFTFLIFLRK